MQQERNRMIEGMLEWKEKEENISNLFSPETLKTTYFQQLKLDHLYELRNAVNHPSKEEKMVLRVLKGEMNLLERRLYPNVIERFFVRLSRDMKNLLGGGLKPDSGHHTNWMLKIDTAVLKPAQQNKNGHTISSAAKQTKERPVLVQKNRLSSKNALKIK